MRPELITTTDQSHTLFLPELGETYHSQNGAIAEAMHVYIKAGLEHVSSSKDRIKILEFGFGTGLNTLLSFIYAETSGITLFYDSVEKYPLDPMLYPQLNYGLQTNAELLYKEVYEATWNETVILSERFILHKSAIDFADVTLPNEYYDLVYYDAFGPSKQAEVWELDMLEKVAKSAQKGAVLVTYCSQGQFKRNLKQLGFDVEKIPGPAGKREMIRATRV